MQLIKCPACSHQVSDEALSCPNCGQPLGKSVQNPQNSDVSKALGLETIKLSKEELPNEEKKFNEWQEGVFIGKEGGKFYADLPPEYNYNHDIRLRDTNAFLIKNPDYSFTVEGVEISTPIGFQENVVDFKNSINTEVEKGIREYKQMGVSLPDSARKLHLVETDKSWWLRATWVYEFDMAMYRKHSGYNLLGKALLKISGAENDMKKEGYKKNLVYREHKILDFFYPKIKNTPSFLLRYAFDEISGGNTRTAMIAINGISDSLGYYTETEMEVEE